MLPVSVFLICTITAVSGWQCPSDVETKKVYVKIGEQAVISFQTTIKSYFRFTYSVTRFDFALYTALFYDNTLQKENLYMNSKFIGNATAGNFTIKMASVKKEDGGTYMLQYITKKDRITEQCAMLYILDKPKKATVYLDKINIEGNNTTLTCNSMSTTYPTNHTLNLTYNWKLDNVTNPPKTRYVYSLNRNTIIIKPIGKEDANASIQCSATESGDEVIGLTSDESEKSLLVVYYGPDMCEINTKSPYIITEGDNTPTINCKADCYPSCSCLWRNESSGSSFGENGSFNITTISRYHTGIYKCICRNTEKDKVAIEQTSSLYIKVEYKSKTSQIAAENTCSDTGITWMVIGIIFGLLSAVLSGYAIYVTILLRKNAMREGKEETARPTESVYYEKVEETSRTADKQSEPSAANTDEYERSVTMYTDLVRYSKDDGRNYDIIQSNK